MNVYDKGDTVKIATSTAFQDADGTAVDPDVVTVTYEDPAGNETSKSYPADAEVSHDGTGEFSLEIDTDIADGVGVWKYEFKGKTSDDVSRGMDDGQFKVRQPKIS